MNKTLLRILLTFAVVMLLTACNSADDAALELQAKNFHPDDECHVCGMMVSDFPGPKGQAVGRDGTRVFCSAAELVGWWLQPENRVAGARLYVHDMAYGSWEQPDDERLIDATAAWYVVETELHSAMGATLASFADEKAARALAEKHHGRVLRFDELDASVLLQHDSAGHDHGHLH